MRIVYMGSPDFALLPLKALADAGYDIASVVTQPDRPRNRGVMQPTPVKSLAESLGLPVLTPVNVNEKTNLAELAALQADLFVVVAYGQFLSRALLAIPPLGAVNIHGSLLPAYRGAAPIHRAILNGEKESGVSIMYLDAGMDSGDVILSRAIPIDENETTGGLHDKLCRLGTELLLEALRRIENGQATRTPQDPTAATFAPMLQKEDERVDWSRSAQAVHNQIRGLNPYPGAYTFYQGKRLKLWESRVDEIPGPAAEAGQVLALGPEAFWVRCGGGCLRLLTVQPEGKAPMSAGAFARGYHIEKGSKLG